jgi:hypothetical protein
MIKYALVCEAGHGFDGWFSDSAAYDKQVKRKLVTCPQCNSTKVDKAIMAPRIASSRRKQESEHASEPPPAAPETSTMAMMSPGEREFRKKLKELRDHVVKHAENVGPRFASEARKMHYGEIEHRSIFGEASLQDAKELNEEGVEFHPLPVLPDDRN